VAVRSGTGNYIGWRLKATDPANLAFNVYRGDTLVTAQPITDSTNYSDANAPCWQRLPRSAGSER